jgi:hypothetical protein
MLSEWVWDRVINWPCTLYKERTMTSGAAPQVYLLFFYFYLPGSFS